ncbi:hypothetical protein ACQ4PT_022246 [Festuca glaucescens]
MDGGAWPARWPPPSPQPPPPPPPQPSASLAPPPPLPRQMDGTNPRYHPRPSAPAAADRSLPNPAPRPERLPPNSAAMPDRLVPTRTTPTPDRFLLNPNPWSSLSAGQPAKAKPGPTSTSLLPQPPGGSYYSYPHVNSRVTDLKSLLHSPSASNAAGAGIDLARPYSTALGGGAAAPPLPKYPRHGLSAGSSVGQQSPLGALFMNKSSNAQGALPGEGSSSGIDGVSQGAGQFQDPGVREMHKLASKPPPRHHQPALPGDRILVSCLNVGGEFFMGEAGIFGILCSCHQLRMSVAKFCEHAGGPAEKAGEIVLMENGMSIAYWFKYCVGVGAYVTDTKWDWPEWMCIDYSPVGYKLKSLPTGNSSMEKVGLFSGYGKSTGPINRTSYSNDLHNKGRECTTVEKMVNKRDETYCRSADVSTSFTKNYALPQSSRINLGLAKKHTVDAVNLNHFSRPTGGPYFTASTGGHYDGNHFAHNYANLLEKNFDVSFRNPAPRPTGVLSYDSRVQRPTFPNKILQDSLGSASNTELKLGQSSYHQSLTSLFPSVQSTAIDFQKPQSHLPLISQNLCPRQTIKVNKSIGEHTKLPLGTGINKQSIEVATGISRFEGGKLTDDATKNSFISVFLSHLERNSEAIDDILNNSEHNLHKALDGACSSNHSKIASRQVEPRVNGNNSKLASTSIHTKRSSDGGSLSRAPSGYVSNVSPLANSQGPLVHSDCGSYELPRQPNAGISKICAGVLCPTNCGSCNHVGISHQIAHVETGAPCLHDKLARGHGTFECVDHLCTRKSLRVSEIICHCGTSCSSSRNFLPSFGIGQTGKSIHRCCYKVQEDVSKLGFRAGDFCHPHFSNDGAPIHKPAIAGLDKLCTCSTFMPRSSLCSREHKLQSSCLECPLDGLHYRSSMGHTTNSLTKYPLVDAPNKKEAEFCCCSVVPKCLAGCGFTKHCNGGIDQSGSNVQKSKHDAQLPSRCCTLGESEKLRCQYSSNNQTSSLKDVSNKTTIRPCVPISERLKNVLEESAAKVIWPYIAGNEKKGSCRGPRVCKEQLKPGFSSGSSSAVVTKFSVSPECNNISSCVDKYGVEREKLVFDEGSRTEKSSSSSYVPTSTGCEKSLNSSSRFHLDTSKVKRKCNEISDGGVLKGNEKKQRSKATKKSRRLECAAEHSQSDDSTRKITLLSSQNGDPQPQNEASSDSCRVSKIKRKYTAMQRNKPVKRPHIPAEHSESDDSTRKITLQSSQNADSQPQNEASSDSCRVSKIKRKNTTIQRNKPMKRPHSLAEHSESDDSSRKVTLQSSRNRDPRPQSEASSYFCRVSKIQRKHTTMRRNKPVKRPHSHHKILKGDKQSDNEGIMVGELNSSDEKRQVNDLDTLVRTKQQQEGSRVFVRKLPKYMSLNCMVNEPNSEDACSGGPRVDASLIATGITNDNRKFPKIVPLNLILKKAKRCHAVRPSCKTENIHSCEEKSAVRSVGKYSFGNRNYSPHTEDGMQSSRKDRHLSNALRPHVEPDCKRRSIDLGEGEPVGLTDIETNQLSVPTSRTGFKNRRSSVSLNMIKRCEESSNGSACSPCGVLALEVYVGRYKERLSSDDSCCVCRIPYLEPCNQLMECSNCNIKVHQACYGVLKVPRGQWFCTPCKANANTQDIVCVICGYGGGAMTRALNAQKILRSSLKALRVTTWSDKNVKHNSFYASKSRSLGSIPSVDKQKSIGSAHEDNTIRSSWTANHNSSLLGPKTMQWIHVVCGLWTPGTKCPNSTTMNAFDISGALPGKRNNACSICNRTGGSFMMCRDINCSAIFHPWCAHQRGLLQSDPEGEHNEQLGFYGQCVNHATVDHSNRVSPEKKCLRSNGWTCARTEGFKGRKGEGCYGSNYKQPRVKSNECSVPQEQIDAWLRINGSKPCIRRQLKGWKHLVVYKSGIHGLGLYTGEFIPRGSLVIEYVGEIVGQRIADKRELEYHSGKRQQYKSVCYFFKIDKEHIIDATRKGGIARFINHSCLPNCVAKIISVRNEKKVVFFSERHINPGEEITYDYHFNQEDKGERIPCFCRSRSCRRYLN